MAKYLKYVLILNGLADMGILTPLGREMMTYKIFQPTFEASNDAIRDLASDLLACGFAMHGITRIAAGLNFSSETFRTLAVLSYLAESLTAALLVYRYGDKLVTSKELTSLIFIPWIGIIGLLFYNGKNKRD